MSPTLILAALLLAIGAAAGFGVEHWRWAAADDHRIAAEAQAEHDRIARERDIRDDDDTAAMVQAQKFEAQRQDLETAYVKASTKLRSALQRPVACAPGQTLLLGDAVVPADALGGLRLAAGGQDGSVAPGPAASQPSR